MNGRTRFFLVVLQLCIGWHLFYEGVWKLQQRDAWSSKGYLRSATGPLALHIRWAAGDPEVVWHEHGLAIPDTTPDFLARFDVRALDSTIAPESRHRHIPPLIDQEWNVYFARFVEHYGLKDTERREQFARAESKLLQVKSDLVTWLTEGVVKVKPANFTGPVDVPVPISRRVQDYEDKLREIGDLESGDAAIFGSKAPAARITQLRFEANAIKKNLQAEIDAQTRQMQRTLFWEVLTPEQRRMERVPAGASSQSWRRVEWLDALMRPIFEKLGWSWPAWDRVQWIDHIVQWGLVVAGLGLIVGLFTRTACTIGIVLLLLFYLTMPPLPGSLESPAGHYLLINYNIIEIVALLLIAVSDPASRYGLDAWSPLRWCRRRKVSPQRHKEHKEIHKDLCAFFVFVVPLWLIELRA